MAAAWFTALADPAKATAISAGTQPGAQVHPVVVQAMQEAGIDVAHVRPQFLSQQVADTAQLLVTMGCGDECPYVPGAERLDWKLPDPKNQPVETVRRIRDDIRERVTALIHAHGWRRTPNES